MKNTKKGFTLIELLVVIAIIGVLSSVVLASLNSARKKSRDSKRVSDVKQVQLALEMYFDSNTTYPAALADLVPEFMPAVPADPLGQALTYEACGSPATAYHLGVSLEENNTGLLSTDAAAAPATCTGTWTADDAVCSGVATTEQGSYCYDVAP